MFYRCYKNALISKSGNDIKTLWRRVNSEYADRYGISDNVFAFATNWASGDTNSLLFVNQEEIFCWRRYVKRSFSKSPWNSKIKLNFQFLSAEDQQ